MVPLSLYWKEMWWAGSYYCLHTLSTPTPQINRQPLADETALRYCLLGWHSTCISSSVSRFLRKYRQSPQFEYTSNTWIFYTWQLKNIWSAWALEPDLCVVIYEINLHINTMIACRLDVHLIKYLVHIPVFHGRHNEALRGQFCTYSWIQSPRKTPRTCQLELRFHDR